MKTAHHITLVQIHAEIFTEICRDCGIFVESHSIPLRDSLCVMTFCEEKDRDAAWGLFHEKLEKITTQK